jgi:hypothetical protein
MGRHLPLAVAIVLVLSILACGGTAPATPASATRLASTPASRSATLSELKQEVQAKQKAEAGWQAAAEGQRIALGGGVRTGDNASARLDITDGTLLRLASNSLFELKVFAPEITDPVTRLKLEAGKLWAGVTQSLGKGTFEVETPEGVATVRGSWMSVSYTATGTPLVVTCLEGKCQLAGASGKSTDLTGGQQSEILGHGQDPTPAHPIDAAELQDWLQNVPEVKSIAVAITPAAPATITPLPPIPTTTGQSACDHPYFPLRPGAKWSYATDVGGGSLTWSVPGTTGEANPAEVNMVWDNGASQGVYQWQCDAQGLTSYAFSTPQAGSAGGEMQISGQKGVFLPAADKLAPGYTWDFAYQVTYAPQGVNMTIKIVYSGKFKVTGDAPIVWNNQKYAALQILETSTTDYEPAAPGHIENTIMYTFAQGVGLVETASTSSLGSTYTLKLADFTIP